MMITINPKIHIPISTTKTSGLFFQINLTKVMQVRMIFQTIILTVIATINRKQPPDKG